MEPSEFAPRQRRQVRRAPGGYWSFHPEPLEPDLDFSPELVSGLAAASRAVGEVSGVGRTLPNPHLLTMSLLRREAVLTSRIEGTQATFSDLVLFEADPHLPNLGDVREVANYIRAANHVLDPNRRLPLSLPLLLEAHRQLMQGVRGEHATPGEFRRSQNWIGTPGCLLDQAGYVPPEPDAMWAALQDLEKYLHASSRFDPLVRIGLIHYQFEAIHPFLDGNGRIGRLLIGMLMVEWGLLPGPLLDISAYLEPRRDDYYQALQGVSRHGDWNTWLRFFLDAVTAQSRATLTRAEQLRALRDDYRSRVTSPRSSSLVPVLIDGLFASPALTITQAQHLLGVTHRAASQNIDKLIQAGILEEVQTPRRTRLFLARGVLDVLGEPSGHRARPPAHALLTASPRPAGGASPHGPRPETSADPDVSEPDHASDTHDPDEQAPR